MTTTTDPIVAEFKERLADRRTQLTGERVAIVASLEEIDAQLASVNATLAGLESPVVLPANGAAKPAKPKKAKTGRQAVIAPAIIKIIRDDLPQDGEWHHWNSILQKVMPLASDTHVQRVLKTLPIERRNSNAGRGQWEARWKDDAPRIAPVAPSEVRDYALAHKDGFTLAELAQHYGRTTEWARQSVMPFVANGMLGRHKRGSNAEKYVYQELPSTTTPKSRPRTKLDTKVHATRGNGPVQGISQQRWPSDKDMAAVCRKAADQGCDVKPTNNDHFKITVPGQKGQVIVSNTPSDRRAATYAKNDLAKHLGVHI